MILSKDILKNPTLSLPIIYDTGNCEDVICDKITQFHSVLKGTYMIDPIKLDCILRFRDNLKKMFSDYYLGHQSDAFYHFTTAMAYINRDAPIIKELLPQIPLYRARTNESNTDFKNDEMFHIKYQERSKVSTQRFSFPGLPCLYLGASTYVCWLELDRPPFDQFQVALVNQTPEDTAKKVLDLSIHPLTFYSELSLREAGIKTEHSDLSLEDYLQFWPIIAACSIAVKNEKHAFKPEYIFPQFLLQMILERKYDFLNDIDGIKYMSIKAGLVSMKQYESDYRTYTNYVFPTTSYEPTEKGFCKELSKYFNITNNYSGKELQVISDLLREKGIKFLKYDGKEEDSIAVKSLICGSNDKGYSYKESIFGRIEAILNNYSYDGEDVSLKI